MGAPPGRATSGRAKRRNIPGSDGWTLVTFQDRRQRNQRPPPFTPYELNPSKQLQPHPKDAASLNTTSTTNAPPPTGSNHPQSIPSRLTGRLGPLPQSYAQVVSSPPKTVPPKVAKPPPPTQNQQQVMRADSRRDNALHAGRPPIKRSGRTGNGIPGKTEPFKPLSPAAITRLLKHLPLPPNPAHPAWARRCFDCFQKGHKPGACKGFMVCLKCKQSGHPTKSCPTRRLEARSVHSSLTPRGNLGEELLSADRPDGTTSFIHETPNFATELNRLRRGVVIDAALVSGHSRYTVN